MILTVWAVRNSVVCHCALSSLLLIPHRSMLSACLWIPSCFSLVLSLYSSFTLWFSTLVSVSQLPVSFVSVQREKIWMYVLIQSEAHCHVSTNKQYQEWCQRGALSPTLSHRRSHCPSFCTISQCWLVSVSGGIGREKKIDFPPPSTDDWPAVNETRKKRGGDCG